MNKLLALESIATAIVLYVAKVGLLDTFLVLYRKTLNFRDFFWKISLEIQLFFVNANPFIITHQLLY